MKTKKKTLKITIAFIGLAILIAGGVVTYMFNQPARNVQDTKTDFSYKSSEIVEEYLTNTQKANDKYLDENGNSKVIEVTGMVASITEDFNKQKVILLKSQNDKAGVSCTFTPETNSHTANISIGDNIRIKGVIRSGATFDEDLDMYENVILEKCDIISNK